MYYIDKSKISEKAAAFLKLKYVNGVTANNIYVYLKNYKIEDLGSKSVADLVNIGIQERTAHKMLEAKFDKNGFEDDLISLERHNEIHNTKILCIEDEEYPQQLKIIPKPPILLYVMGNVESLGYCGIGIVGSRKSSRYGLNSSYKISSDLAKNGVTIISGLAYGIDLEAHRGALDAKGSTIAVLGSGLDHIYPKNHVKYVKDIIDKGAVVTEYAFNTQPIGHNFPVRNRIISGLSMGVLVVEASNNSGSLHTANYAFNQDRNVYAMPAGGDIKNSATNKLIKNSKAKLVEDYIDIVEDFTLLNIKPQNVEESENRNIEDINFDSERKKMIYDKLLLGSLTIDELSICLELPIENIISDVTELELENIIEKNINAKYYVL